MFNISVLLDVQANLPETSPFFVCPIGLGEHLFSNVYIVHGMYNFELGLDFEFSFMDLFFNRSLKYDYLFVINYKLILSLHRWQAYPWQPPDFQADIR